MLLYIGIILLIIGIYYNNINKTQRKPKPKLKPKIVKQNNEIVNNIKIDVKNFDSVLHDYNTDDMNKFYQNMDGYYQLNTKYDKISDMFSEMFNRSNKSKFGLDINEAPPELFYL